MGLGKRNFITHISDATFVSNTEPSSAGLETGMTWFRPLTGILKVWDDPLNTWVTGTSGTSGTDEDSQSIGSLWVCGSNNRGQLGLNDIIFRSSPTQVGSDTDWNSMGASYSESFYIKTNGTLWSTGENQTGVLGQNDTISRSSPTQVGSDTTWKKARTCIHGQLDDGTVILLKTDNTLWACGYNTQGQLGLNDTNHRSSPTQIGSDSTWSDISYGGGSLSGTQNGHYLSVKTDGSLWAWGRNTYGELGHDDDVWRSSPIQIGTDTDWSLVGAGYYTSMALKTDGTLWTWGFHQFGRLGLNTTNISRSSPTQVGTDTDWAKINMGYSHATALKSNGTLWTWGRNTYGELGLNDTISRSSPIQIGADTNWKKVKIGVGQAVALKSNGSLWSWGKNDYGQGGQNDIIQRSSPTQIGSDTDWNHLDGKYNTLLLKTP